ncbi:Aminoacylase-1 [Smittium mucronatum]|uniref:Aminoacylase-1 n=1 Tax=Smittium mucronatum TaxID=133383 RepID=A0A1R0H4P5_9FUNG|nr:Aminoacylase-1 [Smittium mucronatum]
MEPACITRFREYLQVNTMQPNPDYAGCEKYLKKQAEEIGLEFKSLELVPGKPTIIMTWRGFDPTLKSLILNSHTDVVPVFEEFWDYPPFSATRVPTDNGDFRIYARGSQDMKIVGSCYLEAIRNLKEHGKNPLRTIHLLFVPDEEIGGEDGMMKFLHTPEFKEMNAGFALDEGIANPGPELYAFYGERTNNAVKFTCRGNTGHGSQFITDTAVSKLLNISRELTEFRNEEEQRLISKYGEVNQSNLGFVTTVNLNIINGGVQVNVVPDNFQAEFDIRVSPDTDLEEFNLWLKGLAEKYDSEIEYPHEVVRSGVSDIGPSNKFYHKMVEVLDAKELKIINAIFPAATDSRYLRAAGIPAIGISPLRNIPVLLHVHNEYVTESLFMEGVDIYTDLIHELSNLEG